MNTGNILINRGGNGEISYYDFSNKPEMTPLQLLIVAAVAAPLLFLVGCVGCLAGAVVYLEKNWKQMRLTKVLTRQKDLEYYAARRFQRCQQRIDVLRSNAIELMEALKRPNDFDFPIPQKMTLMDRLSTRLPESYWKGFPWDKFLKTKFIQKSKTPKHPDKIALVKLGKIRIKMIHLFNQRHLFLNQKKDQKLESAQRIAELSFVKNSFKIHEDKAMLKACVCLLFPTGIFWYYYFSLPSNDRLTYVGKKHFLPANTKLTQYADLVDAHNQLVKNNPFLVPYFPKV